MAKTPEEKKASQAAAHKRWRLSEKGKAYLLKKKCKEAGVKPEVNNEPTPGS